MTKPTTDTTRDHPLAIEFVHQVWPARADQLAAMRSAVYGWLTPLELPEDTRHDIVLAVSEAATNVVEHAYTPATADGTVELTFWTEGTTLYIEIVDHGAWRTPPDQPNGHGLGLRLMHQLIEFVLIQYDRRGTRILLRHPSVCEERDQTGPVEPYPS
jgi:anti-sigma regulatory factor (Ser/Thr protein kinase)